MYVSDRLTGRDAIVLPNGNAFWLKLALDCFSNISHSNSEFSCFFFSNIQYGFNMPIGYYQHMGTAPLLPCH